MLVLPAAAARYAVPAPGPLFARSLCPPGKFPWGPRMTASHYNTSLTASLGDEMRRRRQHTPSLAVAAAAAAVPESGAPAGVTEQDGQVSDDAAPRVAAPHAASDDSDELSGQEAVPLPPLAAKPPRPAVDTSAVEQDQAGGLGAGTSTTASSSSSSSSTVNSSNSVGNSGSGDGGSNGSTSSTSAVATSPGGAARWKRHNPPPDAFARLFPERKEGPGEVVVAGRRYASLLDLRHHMRALQRQLLGSLDEVDVPRGSPHFDTIEGLFNLHPQRGKKARGAIRSFYVVRNPHVLGGKGCEFQFEDERGVRDDFSLLKCTRPPMRVSKRNLLVEACGHAVTWQFADAEAAAADDPAQRSARGDLLCSRCGSDFKVQIAYAGLPLSKLVDAYREREAPGRAPLRFDFDPDTKQAMLPDPSYPTSYGAWSRGWMDFHRRNAELAPLCKCCQGAAADERRAQRVAAKNKATGEDDAAAQADGM